MTKFRWLTMSKIERLKYSMNVYYHNKQRFHFAGFIFDFKNMIIIREEDDV